MGILSESWVRTAIELAAPGVEKILQYQGATWGPKWVTGMVFCPGLELPINFQFSCEPKGFDWKDEWGKRSEYEEIARKKMDAAIRERASTSEIVSLKPWCLDNGEFLYPGGVYCDGIAVAVSGAKGWADEAIAKCLLALIVMLAHLETDKRISKKEMRV